METPVKRFVFRSPLAIAGIILLVCGSLLAALIFVLKAEPKNGFYVFAGTGLVFLLINPLILRSRNSLLWQGMLIGAALASVVWSFL